MNNSLSQKENIIINNFLTRNGISLEDNQPYQLKMYVGLLNTTQKGDPELKVQEGELMTSS